MPSLHRAACILPPSSRFEARVVTILAVNVLNHVGLDWAVFGNHQQYTMFRICATFAWR